jgi:hypothetical protein
MPTVVACPSCGKKLKLPEEAKAAKARCPACGASIATAQGRITAAPAAPPRKDSIRRPPSPPAESVVEVKPADDAPRRRKKKRRRKEAESTSDIPLWVWLAVAAVIVLFGGILTIAFVHAGYGLQVLGFAIGMAILLPVSVVILVISMFISSAILGGIDFGQAHIAIPKAAALLFVVTLVGMIPFIGWALALPVWFLGLMGLFRLDFAEARILVFINWCLNSLVRMFVVGAIVTAMMHSGGGGNPGHKDDEMDDEPPGAQHVQPGNQKPVAPWRKVP